MLMNATMIRLHCWLVHTSMLLHEAITHVLPSCLSAFWLISYKHLPTGNNRHWVWQVSLIRRDSWFRHCANSNGRRQPNQQRTSYWQEHDEGSSKGSCNARNPEGCMDGFITSSDQPALSVSDRQTQKPRHSMAEGCIESVWIRQRQMSALIFYPFSNRWLIT